MPVGFLSQEQRQRYGCFTGEPTSNQLASYFYLDDADQKLVRKRRSEHNRLGFALQLGTVRFLGTFLAKPTEIPPGIVAYVAVQLKVADIHCLERYCQSQTWWDHITEICHYYGYQEFSKQPEHWRLVRWLYYRAWLGDESPSIMFDRASAYLVERKILLPGVTVLERLVASIRQRVQNRAGHQLAALPSAQQKQQLEALLIADAGTQQTPLEQLRRSPTRYSSPALVAALHRLIQIRNL